MSVFTDDIETIEYNIQESGVVEKDELLNFIESLEYDSDLDILLQFKDIVVKIEYLPATEEEPIMFGLSINEEIIKLPTSIQNLRSLGEFLFTYLNQNY